MSIYRYRLEDMFQRISSVCATRISLGLLINGDLLLASSRRLIIGGPVTASSVGS